MRRWGVILLVFGIGSFVLPLMGLQFRLLNLFGENREAAGVALGAVGATLIGLSFVMGRGFNNSLPPETK